MLGLRRHRDTQIDLWQGDITTFACDAMGNAANAELAGGGGVDGAIHRVGGPSVMAECRRIGGCATGSAVITGAGQLPARWLIHAVGPVWRGGHHAEEAQLTSAYRGIFTLADEAKARHLAVPAISAGVYGYPVEDAARVALETLKTYLDFRTVTPPPVLQRVTFVLFNAGIYKVFQKALFATFPET